MKKFILSGIVIIAFIAYALNQKVVTPVSTPNSITVETVTGGVSSSPIVPAMSTKLVTTSKPTPTPSPKPVTIPTPIPTPIVNTGKYRNGRYTGDSADAYYGNVQVEAVIQGGQIADVIFLDHPQDRGTSIRINNYAMPILKSEAIQAQSANVDTVSGASDTSAAFKQSLASALAQAVN